MNKTYLVGLMTMVVALAGCSNPPVSVKGDVSVVAAKDTETTDQNIHINEANTQGIISAVQPQSMSQNAKIPEKVRQVVKPIRAVNLQLIKNNKVNYKVRVRH